MDQNVKTIKTDLLVLTEFIWMYRGLYTSTQMFVDWNSLIDAVFLYSRT